MSDLYYVQEEMHADQAEQREDMTEQQEELKRILRRIIEIDNARGPLTYGLRIGEFTLLCNALRIDIRDVT